MDLPKVYVKKILEYNQHCDVRGVSFPKRVALIAQRLQNHDGVRISSAILDAIRDVMEDDNPDAPLYEALGAYLHMLDTVLRFFAKQNDVQYVQKSVRFKERPTVVFECHRTGRKLLKYEKMISNVMQSYQMWIYKDSASLVVEGVVHDCLSPTQIETHYSEIVKRRLVIVGKR